MCAGSLSPGDAHHARRDPWTCAARAEPGPAQLKFFRNSLIVPCVSSCETSPEIEQTLTKPTRRIVPSVNAEPKTVRAEEPRFKSVSMASQRYKSGATARRGLHARRRGPYWAIGVEPSAAGRKLLLPKGSFRIFVAAFRTPKNSRGGRCPVTGACSSTG